MRTRRLPDLSDLLLWCVPFLCLFALRNNDLWWHLAAGRAMFEGHGFLHGDPFSFTGFIGDWVDNEWLAQLVFFVASRIGGNFALVVLRALLYVLVALALRWFLRAGRQPSAFLPCLVVGIALSYGWWTLRPSVFSILGTLVLLAILERIRHTGRGFAALPFLFLVWASLHPGFLFGLCLLAGTVAALYVEPFLPAWPRWSALSGTRGRLALAGGASVLATLANPYGWRVYAQQLAIAHNAAYRAVLDEWVPPSPALLALLILVVAAFLVARFSRVPAAAWVPILAASALATTGVRFIEYFALVAVPAMAVHAGPLRKRARLAIVFAFMAASIVVGLRSPLAVAMREGLPGAGADPVEARVEGRIERNAILLGLLVVAAAGSWALRRRDGPQSVLSMSRGRSGAASVAAATALAAIVAGVAPRWGGLPAEYVEPDRYPTACLASVSDGHHRTFNRMSWGGWLIWKARMPTFIDGRGWGQPIFFDYARCQGPGWRKVFDDYRIDRAIVPREGAVSEELSRAPDWERICVDPVAAVYERRAE